MPKRRKRTKATSTTITMTTLADLRRQARAVVKRFQRAGRQQLATIEKEITRLNKRRHALVQEINAALGSVSAGLVGRGGANAGQRRGRRGGRGRVNWDAVYARLPKGPFSAGDVRKFVSGVAAGTFSQRLTGWVREKKLKRTGSRRGTRYTKAA